MFILDFIIDEIFAVGAIFLGLIALVGLLIQKKDISSVISGTVKTIVGVAILGVGIDVLIGAIVPLLGAFEAIGPSVYEGNAIDWGSMDTFLSDYGTQIGIVMISAFAINLLVARITPFKNVFLTGHMMFWFPAVFLAAGISGGMTVTGAVILALIFTSMYFVITPAIIRPFVRKVTGDDSFTLGHPTVGLSLVGAWTARLFGNKEKSTEDIKFPKSLEFLREITITSSIVIFIVYLVMGGITLFSYDGVISDVFGNENNFIMFSLMEGITFGAGLTVMLLGVRMMLAEIVPAFKGISDKVIPGAVPALDCPIIFPFAPNAVLIGFIVSMITSTIAIIMVGAFGIFPFLILPLVITCFFEIGTAAVFGNAEGGLRGAIIGSAVAGVLMVVLLGISISFFHGTIADWLMIFGGNDFSLWGSIAGFFARIFGG